ncbi:hypothetical protein [Mesorhizobium sp. M7A.F.Ca.ET.027.02.1.1]|uniref:hypothetical protein n=1 Tax=Mesorhizobium sp. M7A.F.Ca.ET.027.02.1.1 TaxID=2496655 RepID=UPI00167AFA3A|nr:hypothetical protein [Mesorhizobium sp. M7A.F.Ca.ET.027.02.1.1]
MSETIQAQEGIGTAAGASVDAAVPIPSCACMVSLMRLMSSRSLDQRRLGDYGFFANFILGRKHKPA